MEDLRHLGPELAPDQLLLTVEEVLRRQRAPDQFWELRTARVGTSEGERYLSGEGQAFLPHVLVVVLLGLGDWRALLLIADGARWLRAFFTDALAALANTTMILDWYHLHQKCAELGSRICDGKQARAKLLLRL